MTETTELMRAPAQETELTVEQIVDRMEKVRDLMKRAMVEGEDYGVIPGTDGKKKPLLQPGAEKLAMMFRLAPSYKIIQADLPGGHREFSVTCRLEHITSGNFCGEATASCSSLEPKYRYRGGARKCPMCGKETIKKSKFPPRNNPTAQPGFYCFGKVGGCGAEFAFDDKEIVNQSEVKTENPDIAGEFNTIVQMAQKRAFLRAIRQATASSELFTQDIGEGDDHEHGTPDADANKNQRRQQSSGEESQVQHEPAKQEPPKKVEHGEWKFMRESMKAFGMRSYKDDAAAIEALIRYAVADATWAKCYDYAPTCKAVLDRWTELQGGSHPLTLEQMKAEAVELASKNPTSEEETVPF